MNQDRKKNIFRDDENFRPNIRLFVFDDLNENSIIKMTQEQSHYLINVMRVRLGNIIFLFNGKDGEWRAEIILREKRQVVVKLISCQRKQFYETELNLFFAPIKRAHIDFLAKKATELGVTELTPVFTEYTQIKRVNIDRLYSNVIEAAEQCRRLSVPVINEPVSLQELLSSWPDRHSLLVADETGEGKPIVDVLGLNLITNKPPYSLLIGPEGGFAFEELQNIDEHDFIYKVSLGPRVMRSETAAIAGLAVIQAFVGDWKLK